MGARDNRRSLLTRYQAQRFKEYEHILDIVGLNTERILRLAEDDPDGVTATIKVMIDQAVRSDVIYEYTFIDSTLDLEIRHHFFGRGKKYIAASKTKRFKTLDLTLQNMYLIKKLEIVRSFRNVPRHIVSNICAINDLRNGLAHTFLVERLKPVKRAYKGHSIFKTEGLTAFHEDSWEILCFFTPWLKSIIEGED